MGRASQSKYTALFLGVVMVASACTSASTNDAAADELLFAEENDARLSAGCDSLVDKVIEAGGVLDNEDPADLMTVWISGAPLVKLPSTKYLSILAELDSAESKSDNAELLDQIVALEREIDDLTYEACGTPVYSAAAAISTSATAPLTLPCFTFQPDRGTSNDLLYGPVDCETGQQLFLHSDGEWREIDEAEVVLTTTVPATTTSRVTRPEPSTTAPTTAPPPTTAPTTASPTTLDPNLPPPTNEDGSPMETTSTVPETTTTTVAAM